MEQRIIECQGGRNYGFIYAGAQKNLGPSGVTVVLIREDLLNQCLDKELPSYLRYRIHVEKNSLYNTPPAFGIYILRNVLAYNKSIGGLDAIYKHNLKKGELRERGPLDSRKKLWNIGRSFAAHHARIGIKVIRMKKC